MDEKLTKSLNDLIDETLSELEELRKSRFAASEIEIKGPGEGIDGKPSNGKLEKEEDEKDEDEDHEEKEEAEEKAAKAEDCMDKKEDKKEEDRDADKKDDMDKKEDKEDKDDEKHPKKKETAEAAKDILEMHKGEWMKKSREESESLVKSYVDEKVKPLEDKLSTILDLVNKLSDQPVAPKGATARTTPLFKSTEEQGTETLSKSQVASKLFDLKKSGTYVDSLDVTKAEMGQDLESIVKKYKIS